LQAERRSLSGEWTCWEPEEIEFLSVEIDLWSLIINWLEAISRGHFFVRQQFLFLEDHVE